MLEVRVLDGAPLAFSLTTAQAGVLVGEAFPFGLLECWLLDEHALALVAFARPAETHDDGGDPALLAGPARRRVPGASKRQVRDPRPRALSIGDTSIPEGGCG